MDKMYETLRLKYGKGEIEFTLPSRNFLGTLQPEKIRPIENPIKEFKRVLQQPIDSPPLQEIVKPGEKVGIIVSDITRVTRVDLILPTLLDELNKIGIPDRHIFILFATGTHRKHTPQEKRQLVSDEVAKRVALFDHDCRDPNANVFVGETKRGTKVFLNKKAVEADRLIVTGTITYHYFAGFSGGRKSVLPGIASLETIVSNHKWTLNQGGNTGSNPKARSGVLHGNPIHEDMVEAARFLKPDFLINTILNHRKELAKIITGNFITAFEEGCKIVSRALGVEIKEKADLTIGSCGGYPKDLVLYQAHKAIENSFHATREGGTSIILAECREGMGADFKEWFVYKSMEEHEAALRRNFKIVGQTAYALRRKAEKINIILVSALPEEEVKEKLMIPARTLEEALKIAYEKLGTTTPTTYVLPQASVTFPKLKNSPPL
jgi:nickel-dependent lactate racemase